MCAYELGVPLDLIKIKANNTLSNANDVTTGGSITSELCCMVSKKKKEVVLPVSCVAW